MGSNLAKVEYALDAQGWVEGRQLVIGTEGRHSLSARAIDIAGNSTQVGPQAFNLDSVAPRTHIDVNPAPVLQDWYNDTVTITLTPTDATSGPAYVEWRLDNGAWKRTTTLTIASEGPHTLEFRSADLAGNQEPTQTRAIHVDNAPPVTSYVILPAETQDGWHTTPVTITLVPSDEGSGVVSTFYRINAGEWQSGTKLVLTASGEYAVEFYSVDAIGHVETAYAIPGGIRIDTDAPRPPTPLETSPRNWTNRNSFDLTLALPPDLSGIAGAYFKVGQPPQNPTDGVWRPGSSNILRNVQAPGEGAFSAYVWLQDGAGNRDHTRRGVWDGPIALHYDGTPPTTTALLEGVSGAGEWYVSPVRARLVATDTLSGVSGVFASIDGSAPVTTTEFTLASPDKHTLRFKSVDNAGNAETEQLVTIRIDPNPPPSPQMVAVSPQTWTPTNSFTLSWTNPPDTSGIAGGYYKIGAAPTRPTDGVLTPPTGVAAGIKAPGEGAWDIHFWLVDQAGNIDLNHVVTLDDALRLDSAPPATSAVVTKGDLAASGWYTSPVSIRLSAVDASSGVDLIRYRLDGDEWIETETVPTINIDTTGQHLLEYHAVDATGNVEAARQFGFKLDYSAPRPGFKPMSRYQRQPSFVLAWEAFEESQGSGLDGFDLQSKDGRNSPWTTWGGVNVPDTEGRYYGAYGHRYFFRMRARDRGATSLAGSSCPGASTSIPSSTATSRPATLGHGATAATWPSP